MTQSATEIEQLIRGTFEAVEPSTAAIAAVTELFRNQQNHPAGIRAPHAIEAMRNAAEVERWAFGANAHFSIALSPRTEARPYDTLITAVEIPVMPGLSINQAWRLYGDWPTGPTAALAAFIARFGLEIEVGGTERGLFVPTYRAQTEQIVRLADDRELPHTISVLYRKDGAGPLEVSWAYAIDDDSYQQYVARNR